MSAEAVVGTTPRSSPRWIQTMTQPPQLLCQVTLTLAEAAQALGSAELRTVSVLAGARVEEEVVFLLHYSTYCLYWNHY